MATPSIFSSHTNEEASATRRLSRPCHATSSSVLKALSSDIIGTACTTGAKSGDAGAPTRWVGESGVTSSGWASSTARSRRTSASYSASGISGSSRAW